MTPVAPRQGEDEARQRTPLDHPLFLPVLFAGCAVWFGYDSYLTQDPKMLEHQAFNRYGFQLLVLLTAHWGYRGHCELQTRRENPWVLPAILAAMAVWIGFNGWWSRDPFNVEHASIARAIFPWVGFASVCYAIAAFRRVDDGKPRFTFAITLAAPALAFGYQGLVVYAGQPEQLVWIAASASLGFIAAWSAVSKLLQRRRSSP